jgi:hypothetical protein
MSAIRYMWVTLGHLRPSGHIMLDMEVIEAQCAWSWRLTIASISSMTGRSSADCGMKPEVRVVWSMMLLILGQSMSSRGLCRADGGPHRAQAARVLQGWWLGWC